MQLTHLAKEEIKAQAGYMICPITNNSKVINNHKPNWEEFDYEHQAWDCFPPAPA